MQEAFRKATESLAAGSSQRELAVRVLKGSYEDLGSNFFNTVVVPFYGRGRMATIPVFEHLKQECLELHPRLVAQPVPDRSLILGAFAHGLRVSEQRVDPGWNRYLDLFDSVDDMDTTAIRPYSRASQLFLFGLILLYGVRETREQGLMEYLKVTFEPRIDHDFIPLQHVRYATANWLDRATF